MSNLKSLLFYNYTLSFLSVSVQIIYIQLVYYKMGSCNCSQTQASTDINDVKITVSGKKIVQTIVLHEKNKYLQWQHLLKMIETKSILKEFLLLPQSIQKTLLSVFSEDELKLSLTYQYCPETLDQKIRVHKENKRMYYESEIWYIILAICKIGKQFEKLRLDVNYINSQNILYNSNNQIKIKFNVHMQLVKSTQRQQNEIILSPQQVQQFKCKNLISNQYQYKSRIFKLGLLILQCSCNESEYSALISSIDHYNKSYFQQNLKIILQKLETHYSSELVDLLKNMLKWNHNERKSFNQILDELQSFQSKIRRRKYGGRSTASIITLQKKQSIVSYQRDDKFFGGSEVSTEQSREFNKNNNNNNRFIKPYQYDIPHLFP